MKTALIILVSLMQACSAANFYESARQNRQIECRKLQGAQYEECMKQYEDDYQTYRHKRDQAQ